MLATAEVLLAADLVGFERWVVEVVGGGSRMEIYKEVGRPENVTERFDLAAMHGTHAIGHTRMATESAVTTDGAHPYSTGKDQCLVHNGSLSNHNNLRRVLKREGFTFDTENDTGVAARHRSAKMREGPSPGATARGTEGAGNSGVFGAEPWSDAIRRDL